MEIGANRGRTAPEPACNGPTARQHRQREIEREHLRAGIALGERARLASRSAARIEDAPWRDLYVVEALEESITHLGFKARRLLIRRRRASKPSSRRSAINR